MMKRYVHSASFAPSTLIGGPTTARWRDPSEWSSRLQSNQALQCHEGCTCASERLTETRFAHSMPPPLHRADKMTGQQVYVLNTTPTTSVPLSLIQMDIELKPYAMLPNLPSEYEVDLFRIWPDSDLPACLLLRCYWGKADIKRSGQFLDL